MHVANITLDMFVEPGFNIAGISRKQQCVRPYSDQPRHFGLDIQICVFAEEWQPCNVDLPCSISSISADFDHIRNPAILKNKLKRRVLQVPATVLGNVNVPDFVPNLEQCLK